ncbi:hypothetical protein ACFTXJ_14985 [Streptomyces zhihengii]|uniref:hypothetical protein n=1 Tax=Streptomyces zhihengii TaxID=1818004 RepID=UPI00363F98EC
MAASMVTPGAMTAWLAIVTAGIGGVVSLASMLLAQRGTERYQAREHERQERHREEDRVRAWDDQLLEARRAAYTKLNAATRAARDALAACMHDLRDTGSVDGARLTEMEERWGEYVLAHAESHMIVSDSVLNLVGHVNGSLRVIYGLVKRLNAGSTRPGDSLDRIQQRLDELWGQLSVLRDEMRRDLGIAGTSRTPDGNLDS